MNFILMDLSEEGVCVWIAFLKHEKLAHFTLYPYNPFKYLVCHIFGLKPYVWSASKLIHDIGMILQNYKIDS